MHTKEAAFRPTLLLLRARKALIGSTPAQVALVVAIWALANWLTTAMRLPLPSGIVGLALLLALLFSRCASPRIVAKGANWLLAEMLLFFVPAAMILMQDPEMLGWLGLKLLLVVGIGTILVMASTALTVELMLRWSRHHAH